MGTQSSGTNQSLVEQWNGTSWSTATSGNENNGATLQTNQLAGISCTSTTSCWAVGFFSNGTATEPLWDHYDGTSWTASTFLVGVANNYWLYGVSCVDANDCWAVGYYHPITGGVDHAWIQQWNGANWINDPSSDVGVLHGVSCVDASHCTAVGQDSTSSQTLIDSWNGTSWSLVPGTPNTSSGTATNDFLRGAACSDTGHCAAVGDLQSPDPTLILMSQVAAPTPLPVPPTGTSVSTLSGGGLPLGGPLLAAGVLVIASGAAVLRT